METNYIEAQGSRVFVGVITDARGDDAEAQAIEYASEALGFDHGAFEHAQVEEWGYEVAYFAH